MVTPERKCDCCAPQQEDGLDRRGFLKAMAAATAALSVTAEAAGGEADSRPYWQKHQLPPEKLAAWKKRVFDLTPPRIYTPGKNPAARFPLGGVGTGNFYLGVDGRMTGWSVTNSMGEFDIGEPFFAVRTQVEKKKPVVRVLATNPPDGTPAIADIRMKGEYPIAELEYVDRALPVEVSLTAHTPFVPLDSKRSGYPASVFRFQLKNPGKRAVRVSLLAAMPNCVGLANESAKGLSHPNYGGNFNEFAREGDLRMIRFRAEAGEAASSDKPVCVYAHSTDRNFDRSWQLTTRHEVPETVKVIRAQASAKIVGQLDATPKGTARVVWLENCGEIEKSFIEGLRKAAEKGATIIFSGSDSTLLRRFAGAAALEVEKKGQPDIVFEDFEAGNFDNWTVEGKAFGQAPQSGTLPNQQPVYGFQGKGLVNSFTDRDTPQGKMISRTFTVERPLIRFLIGGGSDPERTCMRLVVGGKAVRVATGRNLERLERKIWDVREFMGRKAHLEIVDAASGGWGHINVDQIVFTENPVDDDWVEPLRELLPAGFSGLKYHAEPIRVARNDALSTIGMKELTFDGWTEYLNLEPINDGEIVLKAPTGEPLVVRRKLGQGSVYLVAARLLSNPWAAGRRTRALALLAGLAGATMTPSTGLAPDAHTFGELVLATPAFARDTLAWGDPGQLVEDFTSGENFHEHKSGARTRPTESGVSEGAALAAEVELAPGAEATIPFLLSWHFPHRVFSRSGKRIGNHYSKVWPNAKAVTTDLARHLDELEELTERFRKTFYDSTLPYWLLDCLTSQMSTTRIQGVCFWMENGIFAGWEGTWCCCQPTCTHVWGYEQTLSRVFPDLERSMRYVDYKRQQLPDGGINNRVDIPVPDQPSGQRPFTDGHCSCVLKAYREVLMSADDKWFEEYWPNIQKAVEYLAARDGKPPRGVLEDEQWHTYDVAAYGPNSFLGTYYLAALRAGEEMAKRAGEPETAARWHRVFERGSKRLIEICWNGEYLYQNFPEYLKRPAQWGPGCLADQLIGQWWAHELGLGYLLPEEIVRKALASIFQYNWLSDLTGWQHRQRWFADGDDKGLLNCTWPKGGRPDRPILYCDEVWTGVEYQVAAHMIREGMLKEAYCIVKGARERYDGRARTRYDRNPWDEKECGGHYARAMSSWSILLALSGFLYDGPRGRMTFAPRLTPENFKSFFTTAEAWGRLSQKRSGNRQTSEIHVAYGRLTLRELTLDVPFEEDAREVLMVLKIGDKHIEPSVRFDNGKAKLSLEKPMTLEEGQTLNVQFRWA